MKGKIIYLTNVDRRFSMMRKSCEDLKLSGDIPKECETIKVENTALWSKLWEDKLQGSQLVIIRFMGTTVRTAFWNKCLPFLKYHDIPFYMDAQGSAEEEVKEGIKEEVIDKIRKYTF